MQCHLLAAMGLLAAAAAAQLPFDRTIVATRFGPTAPAGTQLLAVDGQGAVTPMGRFAHDFFVPLAIEYDPIDGHLLLALAMPGGTSRVLRLVPQGLQIQREIVLGDIAGPVTQLAVVGDSIYASVGGAQGGLYQLPRRGFGAVQVLAQPNLDAMFVSGQESTGLLAWSRTTTPPAQGALAYYDFGTMQPTVGPRGFGTWAPAVTGITDLGIGRSQQLLAFADGSFAIYHQAYGQPLRLQMALPPGDIVAMKSPRPALDAMGLGGIANPFLFHIDSNRGVITNRSAPLPGDPVDFTLALPRTPQTRPFAVSCGAPTLTISAGTPNLGNAQFSIDLGGALPLQGCLFVAGFRDHEAFGALLPQLLPGGCSLHVEPLLVNLHVTNAARTASQPMAIPNLPGLLGTFVFAQWLQVQGSAFLGSPGLSVQVGP